MDTASALYMQRNAHVCTLSSILVVGGGIVVGMDPWWEGVIFRPAIPGLCVQATPVHE